MTQDQINEDVLISYLKGELAAADAAEIEKWYDLSTENQKMLGQIYYILYINDRINISEGVDVERSLKQLKARMSAQRDNTTSLRRIVWRVAVAAVVAVAVVSGTWATSSLAERMSHPVTIVTQLGERSQVVLPDGTKVWLNSCSRVEYFSKLFSHERRVEMAGEVYFEVQHDNGAPFVVSTNGLDIRVLGTKFNVRNDNDKHLITTVLLDGSIQAHPTNMTVPSMRLRPSQQLVFNTQTQRMDLSECATAERSISWIDGRFLFEQNTLEYIVSELKRYYNVDIHFMDDNLKTECFSGNFKIEDGIYHIMAILQLTDKFHYKINNNEIELYAN